MASAAVALPPGLDASKLSKDVAAYSDLQLERLSFIPPVPKVLTSPAKIVKGPPTTAAGNEDLIKELFPNLYGQPAVQLEAAADAASATFAPTKLGVVLSGGQAPGGHNVIAGLFDFLQQKAPGSTLIGFKGGPAGIMKNKTVVITPEFLYPYRNQGGFDIICSGRDKIETPEQFKMAEDTVKALGLSGLVVIGGDDSNTNACLLAEHFTAKNVPVKVIGCPKTIDGDLKSKEVPISFGFDTACKTYSESIGNIMLDARSGKRFYHFVRLMGRAASHITLECALQTHPNSAIIGEEVSEKKLTLAQVTQAVADMVCARSEKGKNYGVVLLAEGLIDFVPDVQQLIAELNEILAKHEVDEGGKWKEVLTPLSRECFDTLPQDIQKQLLLERDPHGNVQVSRIETEKLLILTVATELEKRREAGKFNGTFDSQAHFCGYEGRCGLPTLFDASYCYALGATAATLLLEGQTGLIASVGNLTCEPEEWTAGGTPLTQLMLIERRKGKNKPVIKKAMVELDGAPFKKYCSLREKWALEDHYCCPGPIQFSGPAAFQPNLTLMLEQGLME